MLAFEPHSQNAIFRAQLDTHGEVRAFPLVVTNTTGEVRVYGRHNSLTSNARLLDHPKYAYQPIATANATTVDAIWKAEAFRPIHILKSDSEGCEWEVLQGASKLLRHPVARPRLLIMAYEDKWSASTYFAAYPVRFSRSGKRAVRNDGRSAFFAVRSPREMLLPTLRSVTAHLWDVEYASYLIGSSHAVSNASGTGAANAETAARVQLIPLSPPFWDDSFELGFDPKGLRLKYTWFDFIAVIRGSAENRLLDRLGGASGTCRTGS